MQSDEWKEYWKRVGYKLMYKYGTNSCKSLTIIVNYLLHRKVKGEFLKAKGNTLHRGDILQVTDSYSYFYPWDVRKILSQLVRKNNVCFRTFFN